MGREGHDYDSAWYAYLTPEEREVVLATDEAKREWMQLNIERTRLMTVAIARKRRIGVKNTRKEITSCAENDDET